MNSPPDLVIFDCDGVLVDSEVISNRIFMESFAELGIAFTLEEMLAFGVGKNAVTLAAAIEQEFGVTLPAGFIEGQRARIMEAFTTELRPIDGVPELPRSAQPEALRGLEQPYPPGPARSHDDRADAAPGAAHLHPRAGRSG